MSLALVLLACLGFAAAAPLSSVRYSSSSGSVGSAVSGWIAYSLGGIDYATSLQSDSEAATFSSAPALAQLTKAGRFPYLPYTVISTNATYISADVMKTTLENYEAIDDVWSTSFLPTVYLIGTASSKVTLSSEACAYLLSKGTSTLLHSGIADASGCTCLTTGQVDYPSMTIRQGPYVATYGESGDSVALLPVYRLYPDTVNAFLNGLFPNADASHFYPLELNQYQNLLIPVPSKLYALGDTRPLAGERFAVKDLYNMAGLVTTAGDKQYGETYGIVNSTCYAVQRLLDLGAVPVGKAKTAPFASGEENELWQWYMYPLNARADGFQTCSASSSGPGCAVGAYSWLDFAIGTDTGESVRRPSAVNGIYGGRPTENIITLDGVIPLSAYEDTAGAMARDPYKFQKIIKHWYAESNLTLPDVYKYPKKLYFPTDYFVGMTPANLAVVDGFIANLTADFGVVRQDLNFTQLIFEQNATYSNMSNILGEETQYQFDNLQLGYIQKFMSLNDGRFPSYDSQWRRDYKPLFAAYEAGERTNETYYTQKLAPKKELVSFIESSFFKADNETCSDSVMIYDIGYGGMPFYREDDLNRLPDYWAGVAANETLWMYSGGISPATTTPDYVIAIGSTPFMSNVSMIEEQLPVTVNLIARPGCDFMLTNWIAAMADKGIVKTVKAGRTMY